MFIIFLPIYHSLHRQCFSIQMYTGIFQLEACMQMYVPLSTQFLKVFLFSLIARHKVYPAASTDETLKFINFHHFVGDPVLR